MCSVRCRAPEGWPTSGTSACCCTRPSRSPASWERWQLSAAATWSPASAAASVWWVDFHYKNRACTSGSVRVYSLKCCYGLNQFGHPDNTFELNKDFHSFSPEKASNHTKRDHLIAGGKLFKLDSVTSFTDVKNGSCRMHFHDKQIYLSCISLKWKPIVSWQEALLRCYKHYITLILHSTAFKIKSAAQKCCF